MVINLGKKYHKMMFFLTLLCRELSNIIMKTPITTSLNNFPSKFEKSKGSENESLHQQTFNETNPSVMKQSLNNSSYDPSFANTYPNSMKRFIS